MFEAVDVTLRTMKPPALQISLACDMSGAHRVKIH